jgi:hypothetical protein
MLKLSFIYIIFLCSFCKSNISQTYFNNRYDNFNNGDLSTSIDTFNNQYLTLGIGINSIYGFSQGLNLKTYDINSGSQTNTKTYFINGVDFAPQFNKPVKLNQHILVCGQKVYSGYNSWVFSWRFNYNLDSIKYMQYGYPNKTNYCVATIKTIDNKIYYTGYTDSINTNSDILLIKTDTIGNEIWKKKIGLPGWDESGYNIRECTNGDLLICGLKQFHSSTSQGPIVMRLDTSGFVKWQNYYPSLTYANPSIDIQEMPNGDIVFTGGKAYAITANGTLRRPMFTKVDALGNLIWQKEYGEQAVGHDFFTFLINNKNNFVVCGEKGFINNSVNGMVYEINQNGDSIFSREYAIQSGSQNYFRDMIKAPDNGYVFSGFFSPIFANGGTGNQDIWLLKTDSNFCESSAYCGYPTFVQQANINIYDLYFRPNPTSGLLSITTPYTFNKIELLSITGQVLLSQTVNDTTHQLNLQNFAEGIYFVKVIYVNGQSVTKKIIKQ